MKGMKELLEQMQAAWPQAHPNLALPAGQLADMLGRMVYEGLFFLAGFLPSLMCRLLQKSHSLAGGPDSMRVELYTKREEKNFFNFFSSFFL